MIIEINSSIFTNEYRRIYTKDGTSVLDYQTVVLLCAVSIVARWKYYGHLDNIICTTRYLTVQKS